jgi:Transposase and inactivated derivatives
VALEPTGAYHLPLLQLLAEKGFQVALVNPYHLAAFRGATGERHKSDRQDALLLARYAQVCGESLRAYTLPPKALQELKALVGYREDLAQRARAILNQLEAARWAGSAEVIPLLQRELACVEGLLGEVEARVQALLAALPEAEVLMGLPGVGPQVAAAVLALLPPRLWGRTKAAALLRGADPRAGGVREERGEESALPEGASPFAEEAFHGGLGGGAARPGDGGLLPSPAVAGKAQKAGPGGRGPQAS